MFVTDPLLERLPVSAATAAAPLLLGSHVERADVLAGAAARAASVVQVNLSAPQTWREPSVKADEALIAESALLVFVHAPYLVNAASLNPQLRDKSRACLQAQAEAAARVGALGLVVHGGHPTGGGCVEDAYASWVDTLSGWTSPVPLLIENTAGGSAGPARQLDSWVELVLLLRARTDQPVGVCLDTCHAWAGGMGADPQVLDVLVGRLGALELVHLNDSKDAEGSGRDRHENLGAGLCPPSWLAEVASSALAAGTPVVVETPNGADAQAADMRWVLSHL